MTLAGPQSPLAVQTTVADVTALPLTVADVTALPGKPLLTVYADLEERVGLKRAHVTASRSYNTLGIHDTRRGHDARGGIHDMRGQHDMRGGMHDARGLRVEERGASVAQSSSRSSSSNSCSDFIRTT